MNNRLYTIREVADILGVSTKTLRRWDQRGRFVPTRTAGNQRRYTEEQIAEFRIQNSEFRTKGRNKVDAFENEPFFKPQAPKESKPIQSLPSILNSLPSNSFLKHHFLLKHKNEVESRADSKESFEPTSFARRPLAKLNTESSAKRPSGFQIGFIFACLVLILSFVGSVAMTRYNLAAGIVQKKDQFVKFIVNLPQISIGIKPHLRQGFGGQAEDLALVSQDNQAVLAAATGNSDLVLNVNVPAFFSQQVGIGTITADPSAMLDLTSEDQGFLAPRMTEAQMNAITSPAAGLFVYNTDTNHYNMYNGTAWQGVFTAIGDSTAGEAFTQTGTSGTSLWFYDAQGRGKLTIANLSAERTYTLPDAGGEISLLGQSIANSELVNSKITVSAGTNLTGGGEVALGSSITLTLKDSIDLAGTLDVSGATTLDGALTVVGATLLNGNMTLGDAATDTITFTGRVAQDSDLIPVGTTGTNDLGSSSLPWDNLYVNNMFAPSSGVSGYWQRNSQALSPTNITDDLLLGSTSTASAKFGFINIAGGNPTATIASNLSLVVPTGNAPSATFNLLNNGTLNFQRSPGGDTGLATALFIQNNGNVGIGNTAPLTALDITGSASLSANLSLRGQGTTHTFDILNNGTLNIRRSAGGDDGLATAMFIQNNGNVGIGTTSPGVKLEVAGAVRINPSSAGFQLYDGATERMHLYFDDSSGLVELNDGGGSSSGVRLVSAVGLLSFHTSGSERMRVTSDGNVGIRNTNPLTALDVTGSASLSANLSLRGQGTAHTFNILDNGTLNFQRSPGGDTGLATAMFIQNNGNVGIGTTNPLNKLDVNGGVAVGSYAGTNAAPSNGLIVSGNVGIKTADPSTFDLEIAGDIGPSTGSQYDLGSSAKRWATVYADTGNFVSIAGVITGGSTTSDDWLINSDNDTADAQDSTLSFERGTSATNVQFKWNSTTKQLSTNSPSFAILPDTTIAYSGTAALMVNQVQAQDLFTASASGTPKFVISNSGNVGIGITAPLTALDVVGSSSMSGNLSLRGQETAHTFNILDSGTLNFQRSPGGDTGLATAMFIQSNGNIGIGNTSPGATLSVGSSTPALISSAGLLTVANTTDSTTGSTGSINTLGGLGVTKDLAIDGGDIVTSATTFNLLNATATTVNFAGAATTLSVGAATGTVTLNNATTAITGALTANGNVTLGNEITDTITFTGRVAQDSDLIPITTTGTNDLGSSDLHWDNLYVDNIWPSSEGTAGHWQKNSGALSPSITTDDMLLGAISTESAKFAFINMASGNPTATISSNLSLIVPTGNAPAATLNLLNNGTLNIRRSPGGDTGLATALFIQNNGNVGIGNTAPSAVLDITGSLKSSSTVTFSNFNANNNILYATVSTGLLAGASTNSTNYCLLSGADGTPVWANCLGGLGSGASKWTEGAGLLYPNNATVDLLLGGTSTASAKFAFINIAGGNPTATISSNLSLAVPTGNAPAATLNLLNNGTLNVQRSPGGDAGLSSALFIQNNGNVGIGNTSPSSLLNVAKTITDLSANTQLTNISPTLNPAGSVSRDTWALIAGPRIQSGNSQNFTSEQALIGVEGNVAHGGTGTITGAKGIQGYISNESTGTITKAYDLYAANANNTGTITNLYGLYVQGLTKGTTTNTGIYIEAPSGAVSNYAIYSAGGTNYFGGNVGIGITAPLTALDVVGSGSMSANLSLRGQATAHTFNILDNGTLNFQRSPGGDGGLATALFIQNNGDLGIGMTNPAAKLDIVTITADDAKSINLGTSADTASDTIYGLYNTIDVAGAGGAVTGLTNYAVGNLNAGTITGMTNYLGPTTLVSGSTITGINNQLYMDSLSSGTGTAYGIKNDLLGQGSGASTLYGTYGNARTSSGDTAYHFYVDNGWGLSDGGTQYGFYSNFSDAQVTYYPIYEASNKGSNILYANTRIGATTAPANVLSVTGTADFTSTVGIGVTTPLAALDVRGASGITPAASVSAQSSFASMIVDNNGIGDLFTASKSGATKFTIANNGDIQFGGSTAFLNTFTSVSTVAQSVTVPDLSGVGGNTDIFCLKNLANCVGTGGAVTVTGTGLTNYVARFTSDVNITKGSVYDAGAGLVGIGTTAPLTALDITGSASLSANISLKGQGTAHTFNILDNGTLNFQRYPSGDAANNSSVLFLQNNSNVGIGNTAPGALLDLGLAGTTLGTLRLAGNTSGNVTVQPAAEAGTWTLTLPATGGTNKYFLQTNGSGTSSWAQVDLAASVTGILPTVNGGSFFNSSLGALYPGNTTLDLLIGGTATSSAKFGFINVAVGNPTATISSNLSLAVPTGNAPAATLNLLNNGTLNVQRSPGGDGGLSTALFIQNNGNVGIGTTAPGYSLDVNGDINIASGKVFRISGTQIAAANLSNGTTGSGAVVLATSPSLTTPTIGAATATSIAIGANTLDTNEWANLDGVNQALATTSSPTFANITDSGLTSGRVTFASTNGLLVDDADMTFATDTLTVTKLGATTLTGTVAGGGQQLNNIVIGTSNPLAGTFTTLQANTGITPDSDDGAYLGQSGTGFSDLFLASGAVINFAAGDVTLTHAANVLGIEGGSVGIGTTAPLTALDIVGSASLSANLSLRGQETAHTFNILDNGSLNFQKSIGGDTGLASVMFLRNDGNVGIGNTAPTSLLSIGSSSQFQVNSAGSIAAAAGITSSGTITFSNFNANNNVLYATVSTGVLAGASTNTENLCLVSGAATPSWAACPGGTSSNWTLDSTNGTLKPNSNTVDLLIGGNATSSAKFAFINIAGGNPTATISSNLSLAVPTGNAPAATLNLLNNGTLNIRRSAGGDTGLASALFIQSNSYVGIGTTVPGALLTLANNSWIGGISTASGTTNMFKVNTADQIQVGASLNVDGSFNLPTDGGYVTAMDMPFAATGTNAYVFRMGSSNLMSLYGESDSNGVASNLRVGIGITTPLLRLDVRDSQDATAAAQIYNTSTNTGADGLVLKLGNTSTSVVASTNHFLSFETAGIGIVGSVQGSGGAGVTYATSGIADFAEYFRKDQGSNIPFGSVVCFDSNGLAVACDNNSNKIIGVASERPAFLGGENLGERSIAVGLVGQVRTRVSTANGAIKIGDPLTTSGTAGVAVKATQTGQILGKAIESFDGQGEGKILVSVNISWYNPSIYVSYDGTLAGMAATVESIGDQLTLQGDQLALQGETLQAQIASQSAATAYVLANDPLFDSLSKKATVAFDAIANLESRINILSAQVEQQASTSAFLTEIINSQVLGASTSAALDLGDIELNNATIAEDLMVLGRTTVTDLGVTGNINAGLLTIHGLEGEIEALGGDLYLQKTGLGGVDILDGKITIDTQGNIIVSGTVTADAVEADSYTVLGDQSIGSAIIPTGATSIEIVTPVASVSSKIFLTTTSLTDKQITVISKSNGKFKVAIPSPTTSPISFDWWIVGNK